MAFEGFDQHCSVLEVGLHGGKHHLGAQLVGATR